MFAETEKLNISSTHLVNVERLVFVSVITFISNKHYDTCISITTSKTESVCKCAVAAVAAFTERTQNKFLCKFFV